MKYFSMFSGIGGFEYGIQQAYMGIESTKTLTEQTKLEIQQWRERTTVEKEHSILSTNQRIGGAICVGYSEIDKYAIQTYERNFNGHTNYGDATTITPTDLPDFDLLVGGFPCQAFSIAGKRKGFDDTRGTLFFDIARILAEKRPRHLVLENVKGLLSHDQGKTFQTILGVLADLGYRVEWQVLNSKDFGVPQNRERVYIVGHLGGKCRGQVFPITGAYQQNTKHIQRHISNTLTARYEAAQATGTYIGEGQLNAQAKIRRLTPTECERLQGFPDGWTIGSDTQRYKQCGNAVTVNVVQAVMEKLL
jgi:DNA-cytosine methyltransferase